MDRISGYYAFPVTPSSLTPATAYTVLLGIGDGQDIRFGQIPVSCCSMVISIVVLLAGHGQYTVSLVIMDGPDIRFGRISDSVFSQYSFINGFSSVVLKLE